MAIIDCLTDNKLVSLCLPNVRLSASLHDTIDVKLIDKFEDNGDETMNNQKVEPIVIDKWHARSVASKLEKALGYKVTVHNDGSTIFFASKPGIGEINDFIKVVGNIKPANDEWVVGNVEVKEILGSYADIEAAKEENLHLNAYGCIRRGKAAKSAERYGW